MLYPSIQDLTHGQVNRYALVIATAKCARHITEKMLEETEYAEKHRELEFLPKSAFADYEVRNPVSVAVSKLASGEYRITPPSET